MAKVDKAPAVKAKVPPPQAKAKGKPKTTETAEDKQPLAAIPEPEAAWKYKVDDALRTLERAEEIRGDGDLMSRVTEAAMSKAEHLGRIAGKLSRRGLISEKAHERMERKVAGGKE